MREKNNWKKHPIKWRGEESIKNSWTLSNFLFFLCKREILIHRESLLEALKNCATIICNVILFYSGCWKQLITKQSILLHCIFIFLITHLFLKIYLFCTILMQKHFHSAHHNKEIIYCKRSELACGTCSANNLRTHEYMGCANCSPFEEQSLSFYFTFTKTHTAGAFKRALQRALFTKRKKISHHCEGVPLNEV